MKNPHRPPRRVPPWLWLTPLVLGAHLALFWVLAGRRALPLAAPVPPSRARPLVPAPTPADFGARDTRERDPRSGEIVTGREFTVPARLATPPPRPPAASPAPRP